MNRNTAVEIVGIPERAELALLPALLMPGERELSGRGHCILTTIISTAEVATVAGRGSRDQHDLPLLPDDQHLAIEIDFDMIGSLRSD